MIRLNKIKKPKKKQNKYKTNKTKHAPPPQKKEKL
jgi:hypothetical protein